MARARAATRSSATRRPCRREREREREKRLLRECACVREREQAEGHKGRRQVRARLGWLSCLLLSHGEGSRVGGGRYLGASFWLCARAIKKKIGCVGGCWSGLSARALLCALRLRVCVPARARACWRAPHCVCVGRGPACTVLLCTSSPLRLPPPFFPCHTRTRTGARARRRAVARAPSRRETGDARDKRGGGGGGVGPGAAPPLLFLCLRPLPRTLLWL